MSSEVAKKRGRPKKVIADPVEVETPKKTTSTAKSKKAPKTPKKKASTPAKTARVEKALPQAIEQSATAFDAAPKPPKTPPKTPPRTDTSKPVTASIRVGSSGPVTPETSKILDQVRELSAKKAANSTSPKPTPPPPTSSKPASHPTKPASKSVPTHPTAKPTSHPSPPQSRARSPLHPTAKAPPLPMKPISIPQSHIPSQKITGITTRPGPRPESNPNNPLSKTYKSAARKWTSAIVAAPILIVTSYVLYQRLVLGEEKRLFPISPGLTAVVVEPTVQDPPPKELDVKVAEAPGQAE